MSAAHLTMKPKPTLSGQTAYLLASYKRRFYDGLVVWWRADAKGYTNDLNQAGLYTERQAAKHVDAETVAVPLAWVISNCRVRVSVDYGDTHDCGRALWTANSLRAELHRDGITINGEPEPSAVAEESEG